MSSRLVASSAAYARELRDIRKRLGLTQIQMAWRLAITARSLSRFEHGAQPVPLTVLRLARFYVMSAAPPFEFIPDRATRTVHLYPDNGCLWRTGPCGGPHYRLEAQVSRRRLLVTCACEQHLARGYLALDQQLRAHEAREAHRQTRMAARRRARQHG